MTLKHTHTCRSMMHVTQYASQSHMQELISGLIGNLHAHFVSCTLRWAAYNLTTQELRPAVIVALR